MMSNIVTTIERLCTQTAVYWGGPTADGEGGYTYDDPVEIDCRWEYRREIFTRMGGGNISEQLISNAIVYVLQDVDEQGLLFLGDLDDLDSADEEQPWEASNVYRIQRVDKIPRLGSTTEFIRKVYL